MGRRPLAVCALVCSPLLACGGPHGAPLTITVPRGATLQSVADTLVARGIVGSRRGFYYFARARGDAREIRAGRYSFRASEGWRNILDDLTAGRVLEFGRRQTVRFVTLVAAMLAIAGEHGIAGRLVLGVGVGVEVAQIHG